MVVRVFGAMLLVAGIVLLIFGFHAENAPVNQLSHAFTGQYTDRTMTYLIVGAVAAVGGLVMALMGRRA
jgi:hypothetical protein